MTMQVRAGGSRTGKERADTSGEKLTQPRSLRVLVCGGRDYQNKSCVFRVLDDLFGRVPVGHVITGGAPGADRHASKWAASRSRTQTIYDADWARHGAKAGPIRNQRMIDEGKPDVVVAFPGGRGTADMVRRAKAAGIEVIEVSLTD